jgi:hypothetical protein
MSPSTRRPWAQEALPTHNLRGLAQPLRPWRTAERPQDSMDISIWSTTLVTPGAAQAALVAASIALQDGALPVKVTLPSDTST